MTTVTAPTDKRFRRAHLKPARTRSRGRLWRWRAPVAAVALGLGLYAAYCGVASVVEHEAFFVDRIVVQGNRRLPSEDVVELLEGLRGASIFTVDLEQGRRMVLASPWVAHAALRRILPSTVDVSIQERAPLGIGRIDGVLYLVDDRGAVIDKYGPNYEDLDLPIIDGLSSNPADEMSDARRAMLVWRLLDSLRARNMAGQISQIDVGDPRNAVVLLEGDPTLLRIGNDRFAERLESYFEIAPALRERVPAIDYVDLRFDERVYVRPAQAGKAPSAGAKPSVPKRGRPTQTG